MTVGDEVIYGQYGGTDIKVDGDEVEVPGAAQSEGMGLQALTGARVGAEAQRDRPARADPDGRACADPGGVGAHRVGAIHG